MVSGKCLRATLSLDSSATFAVMKELRPTIIHTACKAHTSGRRNILATQLGNSFVLVLRPGRPTTMEVRVCTSRVSAGEKAYKWRSACFWFMRILQKHYSILAINPSNLITTNPTNAHLVFNLRSWDKQPTTFTFSPYCCYPASIASFCS